MSKNNILEIEKETIKKNIKIKSTGDIEINGRVYFIPEKYISNTIINLGFEFKALYKIIIAMYLDLLIVNNKIESIITINKTHMNDACNSASKIICYITTGKLYISHIGYIENQILAKIPDYLYHKINPNIIEKIDA